MVSEEDASQTEEGSHPVKAMSVRLEYRRCHPCGHSSDDPIRDLRVLVLRVLDLEVRIGGSLSIPVHLDTSGTATRRSRTPNHGLHLRQCRRCRRSTKDTSGPCLQVSQYPGERDNCVHESSDDCRVVTIVRQVHYQWFQLLTRHRSAQLLVGMCIFNCMHHVASE